MMLCRINQKNEILPIIQNDFLKTRLSDLIELNENATKLPLTFTYTPISIGKLRLILHVEHALKSLKQFGFTKKDIDEVKGIFSEANLYLLCGTMFIASVHVGCLILFTNWTFLRDMFLHFSSSLISCHSKTTFRFGDKRKAMWVFRYGPRCGEHSVR